MRFTNRWLSLVVLGVAMLLALVVTARAQSSGVFEGQVVNGTAGGPEVGAGITVTLSVLQGVAEIDSLEATTDAQGRFRFEGLDTDAELDYWPEAFYLGVSYSSLEPYRFAGDQTALQGTVTVYETTDDDSTVTLDSVHMIAESFGEVLRISEIHLFGNTGDRTFAGRAGDADAERLTTVHIPLPPETVGLAFEQDTAVDRFVEVEGGLVDTEPVPPGKETAMVFFSYHLLVGGEEVPLERSFAYPVGTLNVLVAQPGLTLRSDQLQARGVELFQGQQYELYTIQGLAAETPLTLELLPVAGASGGEGMPTTPAGGEQNATGAPTRGNQALLRWFGFGLAVLAVIGALVYPAVSRQPATPAETGPSPRLRPGQALATNPEAQQLLAELADLEAGFEAGQVDGAAYEQQRAEKYEALKSL